MITLAVYFVVYLLLGFSWFKFTYEATLSFDENEEWDPVMKVTTVVLWPFLITYFIIVFIYDFTFKQ